MTNLDRRLERLEEKIQSFYRPTHIHLLRGDEEGNLVLFACSKSGNPDGCPRGEPSIAGWAGARSTLR
jgi:hypothetical protein